MNFCLEEYILKVCFPASCTESDHVHHSLAGY